MIRVTVAACALGLAAGWNVTNVGAIPTQIAAAYEIRVAVVGLFTTALFVTHLLMQIPGGKASDRFGARRVGLLGLLVMAAGALFSMVAPIPALGLAARALTGVGTGLSFISGSAYVRAHGGSAFRQGLYGGVSLSAGGLALAIVPQLAGSLGWRAPYWTALALAGVALLVVADAPGDPAPAPHGRSVARMAVLRDASLHRLAILYSASFGLSVVIGNWVVELLERHGGVDNTTAGVVGGLTLLLGIITRPLGGWILRTHPDATRPAVGASVLAGAVGTLALLLAEPVWLAAIGGALVGLGAGIPFSPSFTGAAVTRPDAPAEAVGFVNSAASVTVLVGTPLVGLTLSLPGDGRIGFAAVVALWLAALALLPSRRSLGAGSATAR